MSSRHNEKWEYNFSLLQEFYAEYGMFPKQKDIYKGVKLGLWCSNQRRDVANGKCLPERYAKLDGIGFLQNNTFDVHWEQNFQKLMLFLDEYGRFPIDTEDYHGWHIGKWCSNQKLHSKLPNYPKDRYDKLNRIGFFDTTHSAKWEEHYQSLVRFVALYNRIPMRQEVFEGFHLGAWCLEQRRKMKDEQYDAVRVQKLQDIGLLNRTATTRSWEERYALLLEYIAEYHKLPVAGEKYRGQGLGNWCEMQKFLARNTDYKPDRKQLLEDVGIFQSTQEAKWEQHFALLEAFVTEFGRLPKQKERYGGKQLGVWCAMQKQRAKKPNCPAERIRKLTEIGLIK